MTLATKNGAIIVKDGKLAEDCGCCGGWYCVGPALAMRATVSLTLPGTIYTTSPPGFRVGPARITTAYAQAISRQYDIESSGCSYLWANTGYSAFNTSSVMAFSDLIQVAIGGDCQAQYSVSVAQLKLWIGADLPSEFGGTIYANCSSFSQGWANAAAVTYTRIAGDQTVTYGDGTTRPRPTFYFPAPKQVSVSGCAASTNYSHAGQAVYGGFGYSLSSGVTATRCVQMLESLDETWTYDIQYVDTSGSAPQEQTLQGALTLRVQAVS